MSMKNFNDTIGNRTRDLTNTKRVAYRLRTRPVCGSGQEEQRCAKTDSVASSQCNQTIVPETQETIISEWNDQTIIGTGHSYNLRSRTHST